MRTLDVKAIKMRRRRLIVTSIVSFFFLVILPKFSLPAEPAPAITAKISDIRFLGGDRYEVRVLLRNYSEQSVTVKKVESTFSLQTEILGHWAGLADDPPAHDADFSITGRGRKEMIYIVQIPMGIPRLYKTFEGEINLKFHYRISPDRSESRLISGESLYWVTPKTDKWVLREGM